MAQKALSFNVSGLPFPTKRIGCLGPLKKFGLKNLIKMFSLGSSPPLLREGVAAAPVDHDVLVLFVSGCQLSISMNQRV